MLTKYGGKCVYGFHGSWDEGVQFVTRRAQTLLKMSNISAPPFFPEYIAPLQGVRRVVREELGKLGGLLVPLDGGFEIKVNATHPPERQNFSCAHEIGHTFFFEEAGLSLIGRIKTAEGEKIGRDWLENLCDISAAELLMPSSVFGKRAAEHKFNISALVPLSNAFNTSIDATAIRLCDFVSKPCYVAHSVLDRSQELGELKLRTTWLTWSRRRMPTKSSRLLFKPKLLGHKAGMLKALRSEKPVYSRERMGIVNFRGHCQIWSQGFDSGANRFVISLIFPESDN